MSNKEKTPEVTPDATVEEPKEKLHKRLWENKFVRYATTAIAGLGIGLALATTLGGSDETSPDSDESDTSEDPQD